MMGERVMGPAPQTAGGSEDGAMGSHLLQVLGGGSGTAAGRTGQQIPWPRALSSQLPPLPPKPALSTLPRTS